MTKLQILSAIVGLYLVLEAVNASAKMNFGDKPCRMIKYLLVGYAGASLIFYTQTWDRLIYGVTISSFMWPRLIENVKKWQEKMKAKEA